MFKKIFILIFVLSPLWYSLLIGYPVLSQKELQIKEKQRPNIAVSRRCFDVGDFSQFRTCLSHAERLNGFALINSVIEKANQISIFLTVILFISFVLFIIISIIL